MTNNYKAQKGKKVTIEDIILETDDKQEKVKRVKLVTDIGHITWRAKIPSQKYVEKNGFKIEVKGAKKQPTLEELPEIVYNIQKQLQHGPIKATVDYSEWLLSDVPKYSMNDRQLYGIELLETKTKKEK
jgi:hypothetical protein